MDPDDILAAWLQLNPPENSTFNSVIQGVITFVLLLYNIYHHNIHKYEPTES